MSGRPIPIPKYGTRPLLTGGGERTPMALTVGAAALFLGMGWQTRSLVGIGTGLLILMAVLPLLRVIGRRDPQMFAVFVRYLAYRRSYPARSTPFGKK